MEFDFSNGAFFLDRDGVINELILNPQTGDYESPKFVDDFIFRPDALEALATLQKIKPLFLVSNQPDYAKGKSTMQQLLDIHRKMVSSLEENDIHFVEYCYCYCHPESRVPDFGKPCDCRKPNTHFLDKIATNFNVDLRKSWVVGDQGSDIEMGLKAGCHTVLIENPHSIQKRGSAKAHFKRGALIDVTDLLGTFH